MILDGMLPQSLMSAVITSAFISFILWYQVKDIKSDLKFIKEKLWDHEGRISKLEGKDD